MIPRIAIFEPNPLGHRLEYVRHLVAGLDEMGLVPDWITSAEAPASAEFAMTLAPVRSLFRTVPVELPGIPVVKKDFRQLATRIASLTQLQDYDRIYFPSGDGIAQFLGLASRIPWRVSLRNLLARCEVLLFGGQFGYPAAGTRRLRNRFSAWSMNPRIWSSAFHLDPYQHAWLSKNSDPCWQLMPDPVDSPGTVEPEAARKRLGLPETGLCVGCAGWIQRNKGADLLVKAFAAALPDLPKGTFLLLAGPFQDGLLAEIESTHAGLVRSRQIVLRDELLPEAALHDVLVSIDLFCLPYHRAMQSSGIFLKAVAYGKPVLVHRAGWLGNSVRLLKNGWLTDIGDAAGFASDLRTALRGTASGLEPDSGRIGRFLEFHSVANFRATWTRRLRNTLQVGDHQGLRSWKWVLQ